MAPRSSIGRTVVVQFGAGDLTFTRCETTEVGDRHIVLRPIDELSGSARRGEPVRLIYNRGGRRRIVSAFCAEDGAPDRLVLAGDRRSHPRRTVDFAMDLTVDASARPLRARTRDLSLSGVRGTTTGALTAGTRVTAMIGDELGFGLATRVQGEVVDNTHPEVRIRFVDLTDATVERLQWLLGEQDAHAVNGS